MLSWQEVGLFDRRNQPTVEAAGFEPAVTPATTATDPQHNHNKNHTPQSFAEVISDTFRTLPEHFPDTFLHEKCATYVQWQELPSALRTALLGWGGLPERAKTAIQEACESQLEDSDAMPE